MLKSPLIPGCQAQAGASQPCCLPAACTAASSEHSGDSALSLPLAEDGKLAAVTVLAASPSAGEAALR